MTDAEFDHLAREINPTIKTGRKKLDRFFATEFNPSTGQWIYRHPELVGIDTILRRYWKEEIRHNGPNAP